MAWSTRPAFTSSSRTSPAKMGRPAASADVQPAGRRASEAKCGGPVSVSSEGPKPGWMWTDPPPMEAIHAAEWGSTGSVEMSACQMLFEGKAQQVVPGGGIARGRGAAFFPVAVDSGAMAGQAVRTARRDAKRIGRRICVKISASRPVRVDRRHRGRGVSWAFRGRCYTGWPAHSGVAQPAERRPVKPMVASSSLAPGALPCGTIRTIAPSWAPEGVIPCRPPCSSRPWARSGPA
jgi:hypothetical protein